MTALLTGSATESWEQVVDTLARLDDQLLQSPRT
jgi:hypothetical protein